jgi:hypothetical protein
LPLTVPQGEEKGEGGGREEHGFSFPLCGALSGGARLKKVMTAQKKSGHPEQQRQVGLRISWGKSTKDSWRLKAPSLSHVTNCTKPLSTR